MRRTLTLSHNAFREIPSCIVRAILSAPSNLVLCNGGNILDRVCLRSGTGPLRRDGCDRSEPVLMRSQRQEKYQTTAVFDVIPLYRWQVVRGGARELVRLAF